MAEVLGMTSFLMALGAIALGSEALRRSSNPADGVSRADLSDLKIALLKTENKTPPDKPTGLNPPRHVWT
jgi:hypothetical protein